MILEQVLEILNKPETISFSISPAKNKMYADIADNLCKDVIRVVKQYTEMYPNQWDITSYQPINDVEDIIIESIANLYHTTSNDYACSLLMGTIGSLITLIDLKGVVMTKEERIELVNQLYSIAYGKT